MIRRIAEARRAGAALAAACVAAAFSLPASAADRSDASPPAIPPIRLLIGEGGLQSAAAGAVIRLGPEDADWSDLGQPIDLPLGRGRGDQGGGLPTSAGHDNLTCLTQAVYYEARSEVLAGQRGVAQVVMNRTRSGGYPTGVCDVVYQRSGRGTCQFTFACDGSMNRLIEPAAWDKAHDVAAQALGGFTYTPFRDATHYHASWMTPYWSSSLTRIGQVGGQVFYR